MSVSGKTSNALKLAIAGFGALSGRGAFRDSVHAKRKLPQYLTRCFKPLDITVSTVIPVEDPPFDSVWRWS